MGIRTPQHRGVEHARHHDVVRIGGGTGDQPRVLPAANAGTKGRRAHWEPPSTAPAASRTARTMFW